MDTVYFNDIAHFRHVKSVGIEEVGETIVNCDNHRRPVLKHGRKAPGELLSLYPHWFSEEKAKSDLIALGFRPVDETMWIKH